MLAIRLPENIETRLGLLAEKTGRTKTYYAREAIIRLIEELEDKYIGLSRLEKPAKRWTLSELEQEMDLKNLSAKSHAIESIERNEELLKLLA
jgi:RHH-type rel operon transcriptional repressor/antitoxin RelB